MEQLQSSSQSSLPRWGCHSPTLLLVAAGSFISQGEMDYWSVLVAGIAGAILEIILAMVWGDGAEEALFSGLAAL